MVYCDHGLDNKIAVSLPYIANSEIFYSKKLSNFMTLRYRSAYICGNNFFYFSDYCCWYRTRLRFDIWKENAFVFWVDRFAVERLTGWKLKPIQFFLLDAKLKRLSELIRFDGRLSWGRHAVVGCMLWYSQSLVDRLTSEYCQLPIHIWIYLIHREGSWFSGIISRK